MTLPWKKSAKIYRDFYNLTLETAQSWQGKAFKAEHENAMLREQLEKANKELERLKKKYAHLEGGYHDVEKYYMDDNT